MSMSGASIKTAATILLTIGDAGTFTTAGHLAAYAGIAPVTRHSGTSIRGEFTARSGNKQLKNSLFRSVGIASCRESASKAYYQKKRDQGKKTQRRRHLPRTAPLRRHLLAQKGHAPQETGTITAALGPIAGLKTCLQRRPATVNSEASFRRPFRASSGPWFARGTRYATRRRGLYHRK